jgi:arsenate reductase (thioredoxin)
VAPVSDPRASEHSTPAEEIHAGLREAMAEVGIDLFQEFPKPLTDEIAKAADVVVTMDRSRTGSRRS